MCIVVHITSAHRVRFVLQKNDDECTISMYHSATYSFVMCPIFLRYKSDCSFCQWPLMNNLLEQKRSAGII